MDEVAFRISGTVDWYDAWRVGNPDPAMQTCHTVGLSSLSQALARLELEFAYERDLVSFQRVKKLLIHQHLRIHGASFPLQMWTFERRQVCVSTVSMSS